MKVNHQALYRAKDLIQKGKFVADSDWSEAQASSDDENTFLAHHDWVEYGEWFLATDSNESAETKGHYKFPYGDFERVHRSAVIAAKQRASQYDYDNVRDAADTLLTLIDLQEESKRSR
jgi:hypothetical protein